MNIKIKTHILVLFVTFTVPHLCDAQKVKVKKGVITLDKKEVAKVDSPSRDIYVFSTLNGEKIFEVNLEGASNGTEEIYHYLKIQNHDGTKKGQVEYEVLITSFKVERIITHLLTVKYNVFNSQGINQAALNRLFDKNQKNLEKKYTGIVAESKQRDIERKERITQIRNTYYPQVSPNKQITFTQGGKVRIVGRINIRPGYDRTRATINIYDLGGNLVATLNTENRKNVSKRYTMQTWDNNQIRYTASRYYTENSNAFLQEMVIELLLSGYMLEHQIEENSTDNALRLIEEAKKNSRNIYKKKGYFVTTKGKRLEGQISLEFEKLELDLKGTRIVRNSQYDYGQKVDFIGKGVDYSTDSFVANNGNYFCIYKKENKEECYYGMQTEGNTLKKILGIASEDNQNIQFNPEYYFKLLQKEDAIMLLQDPVSNYRYIIKIHDKLKGFAVDERSKKVLSRKLAKYMSDCSSLSKKILNREYDVKLEENLYQIIEEYQKCKK